MRLKVLLIFCTLCYSAQAQDYFALRASKDSADGFMPFYDAHENTIDIMLSIDPTLDLKKHFITYAFQNKSNINSMIDLYTGTINLKSSDFNYSVPINDTFVKSGNYRLILSLKTLKEETVLQERDFHFQTLRAANSFYNPLVSNGQLISKRVVQSAGNIDISKTFVAKYDLNRIKSNLKTLSALAEKPEQSALNGIIKSDKINECRRFFYNFWYSRNPQNPEAEWKLYAKRLNYCARKFAYGTYKGYETDMGRIYLRFGSPNRMLKASSERGTRPYEIWYYGELDKHTNINILFAQLGTLANERVILHSSDPTFYFNPNWQSQLFIDQQEQLNKNSHRVYEFFK